MEGRNRDGVLSSVVWVLSSLISLVVLCGHAVEAANTSRTKAAKTTEERVPRPILGNQKSRIYHLPGCPNYEQISVGHRVKFGSEEEAKAKGYRKAKNCS